MFKFEGKPIRVEVTATTWNAYSENATPTWRDHTLFALLDRQGGVSSSVPEGTYYFNVRRVGLTLVASLDPK